MVHKNANVAPLVTVKTPESSANGNAVPETATRGRDAGAFRGADGVFRRILKLRVASCREGLKGHTSYIRP